MLGLLLTWLVVGLLVTRLTRSAQEERERSGHWMGFSSREARLAGRVREGEDRIQWLTLQLTNTQHKLHKVRHRLVNGKVSGLITTGLFKVIGRAMFFTPLSELNKNINISLSDMHLLSTFNDPVKYKYPKFVP